MSKVKIITAKIRSLLEQFPATQDSDMKLLAVYYERQLSEMKLDSDRMSAKEFIRLLFRGDLEHPESIMRSRRKIQEEVPELRGTTYKGRQAKVKEVKEQLGYVVNDFTANPPSEPKDKPYQSELQFK